jgi:hypothetical protein
VNFSVVFSAREGLVDESRFFVEDREGPRLIAERRAT